MGVNPEMIVRLAATWHIRPEMSRMSMIFVTNLHAHEESGLISGKKNSRMFMAP